MNVTAKRQPITVTARLPVVREYDIMGTKYIVTATARTGADENGLAKVRRLIRNDMSRKAED